MLSKYSKNNIFFIRMIVLLFVGLTLLSPALAQDSTVTPPVEEASEPVTPTNTENQPANTNVTPPNNNAPIPPVYRPKPKPKPKPVVIIEDDKNPFELVDYGTPLPNEGNGDDPAIEESEIDIDAPRDTAVNPENPFELVRNGNIAMLDKVEFTAEDDTKKTIKRKSKKKEKALFDNSKLNFDAIIKFVALLIMSFFLAYIINIYQKDLNRIYKAYANRNMMVQLQREKGSLLQMPYLLLYLIFAISLGCLAFLTLDYYNIHIFKNSLLSLLACIAGVGGFYILKHLLLSIIGSIFPFGKQMSQYQFILGIYNQVLGLALFPVVTLIAFAPEQIRVYAIYLAFVLVGFILLNRIIRSTSVADKFLQFHKFHLIIYICTVEIAPIFLLLKLGMSFG